MYIYKDSLICAKLEKKLALKSVYILNSKKANLSFRSRLTREKYRDSGEIDRGSDQRKAVGWRKLRRKRFYRKPEELIWLTGQVRRIKLLLYAKCRSEFCDEEGLEHG